MEEALSSYFLFGAASFIIDAKPLNKHLKRNDPKNKKISVQNYDRILKDKLKRSSFFTNIMDNVFELDNQSCIENRFKKLDEDHLIKPLIKKMIRPEVVHKLKRGRLKQLKRKIEPKYLPLV